MAKAHTPGFLKLVEAAKGRVREVSVEEVVSKQKRGELFHFVDVREESEWAAGHARGATHIGKGVIERDVEERIPNKSDLVVLYCGGGFRSALAGEALQAMGYANVLSMAGGIRSWREAGLPEEK
jgi:rhodanese-related sulfurtransferase